MEQDPLDSEAIAASTKIPAEFALIFDRHFDVVHGYIRKRVGGSLVDDLGPTLRHAGRPSLEETLGLLRCASAAHPVQSSSS